MIKKNLQKLVLWSVTTKLLYFPRKIIIRIFLFVIKSTKGSFIFINDSWSTKAGYDPEIHKSKELIRKIANETVMLLGEWEALQIFLAVKKTAKIKGDIAEVGVFRGGSAKLICEANKENKNVHLFDTFEGLPDLNQIDDPEQFHKGQYSALYDDVKNYLINYQNVHFYKGLFPATAIPIANKTFSFVHLDVDLYEATLESIKFFYSRLNKGGILISHDYSSSPGVRKAFDEFFSNKPEPIIEVDFLGSQCLIVKT